MPKQMRELLDAYVAGLNAYVADHPEVHPRLLTRFEPSVLRAAAMASLAAVSVFLARPASGIRLLALATTGLLLVDPLLVWSVGFLLSVGATAGIVLLSRPLAARTGWGWA